MCDVDRCELQRDTTSVVCCCIQTSISLALVVSLYPAGLRDTAPLTYLEIPAHKLCPANVRPSFNFSYSKHMYNASL